MARVRVIHAGNDGTVRRLVSQHVTGTKHFEHVRAFTQDADPIIDRVKFLADKVNNAPAVAGGRKMEYLGSVPAAIVMEWCKRKNVTIDAFARNDDGIKDKFKVWFLNNPDLSKFHAKGHQHQIKHVYGGDK